MEDFRYVYTVTYTVTVPVTVISSGGRRTADTIAHTAVAKGLLRVGPDDLDRVSVEFVACRPAQPHDVAEGGANVFRDNEEEEVRDDD